MATTIRSSSRHYSLKSMYISLMWLFSGFNVSAQMALDKLDYNRVPQKKIKSFVECQKRTGNNHFSDFAPKCFRQEDSASYHNITTIYIIHGNEDDVWAEYIGIQPSQAYSGRIINFGFLYSKDEDKIIYREDDYEKMKVGQVFFFNVSLLGGIKNLGIADEVTEIDDQHKIIRFCYVENGKTEGTQEIQLKRTLEGFTEVTHGTWYKSKSRFRDNYLYPFFHTRSVNEFHHIIQDKFENKELLISGPCLEN